MSAQESNKELEARRLLENELRTDEELLAYTSGKIVNVYHIGLTRERLLLLPIQGNQSIGQGLSIQRDYITAWNWSGLSGNLKVKLNQDELNFRCRGSWKKRAKALVAVQTQTPVSRETGEATQSTAQQLQQIQAFQQLGLLNLAQAELTRATALDPGLENDPRFAPLRQKIIELGLALRVGAGFFFVTLTILVVLAVLGNVRINPVGVIIFILAGVNLWLRRSHWRVGGILLGVLGAVIFGINFYNSTGMLGVLTWVAFGAAVVLVLTGESKRNRTWSAIGIYAIGHTGVLLLTVSN